jgi:thymidine kinase
MSMEFLEAELESGYCASIIGPMFAGKTTADIRILRDCRKRGIKALGFKPTCDTRYGDGAVFHSHDNDTESCILIDDIQEVLANPDYNEAHVIIIEEAHFFDNSILNVIDQMMIDKKKVVISGLSGSYQQKCIGSMANIMAMSDSIIQLFATCEYCDTITNAPFTIKVNGSHTALEVGSKEIYKPVCRKHFTKYDDSI